jgi:hypothetical protein
MSDRRAGDHRCGECVKAERIESGEPAHVKVSYPNDQHPGLRTQVWVCDEHFTMLADDYGKDLRIEVRDWR